MQIEMSIEGMKVICTNGHYNNIGDHYWMAKTTETVRGPDGRYFLEGCGNTPEAAAMGIQSSLDYIHSKGY